MHLKVFSDWSGPQDQVLPQLFWPSAFSRGVTASVYMSPTSTVSPPAFIWSSGSLSFFTSQSCSEPTLDTTPSTTFLSSNTRWNVPLSSLLGTNSWERIWWVKLILLCQRSKCQAGGTFELLNLAISSALALNSQRLPEAKSLTAGLWEVQSGHYQTQGRWYFQWIQNNFNILITSISILVYNAENSESLCGVGQRHDIHNMAPLEGSWGFNRHWRHSLCTTCVYIWVTNFEGSKD